MSETEYVSEIEQELLDATNFVPEKKYRKRQDYLAALMREVCNLNDEDFNELTDPAAEWSSNAVNAFKAGDELPDFANGAAHDPESVVVEGDEGSETDAVAASVSDEDTGDGEQTAEKKEKKKPGRPKGKGKAKVAKAKKEPKEPKAPKEPKGRVVPRGNNEWGVANTTKSDLVCRMLAQEGGTTMKEIIEATGHAHYNLVNRLARHGYTIVKDGLNIRLVKQG